MNNKISIIPLNCGYGVGLNSFSTFNESEYNSTSTRAILYKKPLVSWFKMKSITSTSYIEPAIFGLDVSDKIKVEFEMCNIKGKGGATIKIVGVSESGVTTDLQSINTLDQTETYFKKYSIEFCLNENAKNNQGIIVNLRQKYINNEMIVKNVSIEIFKPSIDLREIVGIVNCKNRFEKIINKSDSSEVKDYSSLKTIDKTIDTSGLVINTSDDTKFKGLYYEVGNNKYRNPKSVYLKGNITSGNIKVTNDIYNKNNIKKQLTVENSISSGEIEKIIYFSNNTDVEYDYLDIGTTGACNFTIDNVIFYKNRFDDVQDMNYSTLLERN